MELSFAVFLLKKKPNQNCFFLVKLLTYCDFISLQIVIAALLAVAFAAPKGEPKADPKAKPHIIVAAAAPVPIIAAPEIVHPIAYDHWAHPIVVPSWNAHPWRWVDW